MCNIALRIPNIGIWLIDWSVARTGRYISVKGPPGTQWVESPRTCLDAVVMKVSFLPLSGIKPRSFNPATSHYIAEKALLKYIKDIWIVIKYLT
jgi:hypothetical protein